MKNFLVTFLATFILGYAFLFFGGALILENFWATFIFIVLIIAILITLLMSLAIKVEKLEERIQLLETKIEGQFHA